MVSDAMIALLPENDITGADTSKTLADTGWKFPDGHFEKLVASGRIQATKISFNDVPKYRLLWEKLANGEINCLMVSALDKPCACDIRILGVAVDRLAAQEKSAAVYFTTARRAFIEEAKTWGAAVHQVWLKKSYV
jgi:hypothetical protein